MTIKKWLRADYADVLALINEKEAEWRVTGNRTRRNWWDVLAGEAHGSPCIIAGTEFPVLRAAQIRKGLPVTANALCRNENEVPPDFRFGRWRKKRLPAKATVRKTVRKMKARKIKNAS